MAHWADRYVGLPGEGPDPCWLLVRQVWADMLGHALPRFDGSVGEAQAVFDHEAVARGFIDVKIGQEQPFDAVLMRGEGRGVHIGIVAAPGLVLHVMRNALSCVEPVKRLHVQRIKRPPFAAVTP